MASGHVRYQTDGTCTLSTTPVSSNYKNQLGGAFTYDGSGDLTYDGTNTLTYDAEGRIATSTASGSTTTYVYGADGQRIGKIQGGVETNYARGTDGSLLATYVGGTFNGYPQEMWVGGKHFGTVTVGTNGAQTSNFSLTNWLGSEVAHTDSVTGVPCAAYLSQPYGDSQTALFDCDTDDIHFTGKERDTESGNDYFGARYYASSMGRFMSPDPSQLYYADPTNPQSFNLYNYGLNNPLVNVDPNGLDCIYTSNLTSTSVSVETVRGDCRSDTDNGVFVDGTVNTNSYTAQVGSDGDVHLGYGYSSDDDSSGTGSDGSYTLTANSGSTDIGAAVAADPDPDATRINSLVQGVAQDTRSLPWLCNTSISVQAQIPKTPVSVGVSADRNGINPSLKLSQSGPNGGAAVTTNGKRAGFQVTAPVTPFLNATLSTGKNQATVGVSRKYNFGPGKVSVGASLTFGYLGDSNCR